ncbi:MAG: phosphate transport system permease protein [Lentimonas sp.]|jgi:phosphate transport system permease protein
MSQITQRIQDSLQKRYRSEKIFKFSGLLSVVLTVSFLLVLFVSIINRGHPAFTAHKISLEIDLTNYEETDRINYRKSVKKSLRSKFTDAKTRTQKSDLYRILSKSAHLELKRKIAKNPEFIGTKVRIWLSASSDVDMLLKGKISRDVKNGKLESAQIEYIEALEKENFVKKVFNTNFFYNADSSEPEIAGMAASLIGSALTIIVFLVASFPIAVMTAFYLEEFAPKNTITDIVEVSINNLAAIPSIIFGLLGLVVYLNFMDLPRSAAIVGGLTLSMLVLPVIIIATRNTIKTIPSTIKDGAIAMGASKVQVMFHHTLPLSLPGIMTGAILATSRALGETAPLLMIGMVAFIADVPRGFFDPTTVMPVQIYLWSDSPELGFAEKSAAAIMVLLAFLISLNGIAVFIRKKFEKKW